jgi:hypothetical protein
LQRVNIEVNHQSTDLWMMTHKDLENAARVKALFDFMPKAMKSDFNRLAGFTS